MTTAFYVNTSGDIVPPYSELPRPLTLNDTDRTAISVLPGDDTGVVYLLIGDENGETITKLSPTAVDKLVDLLKGAVTL